MLAKQAARRMAPAAPVFAGKAGSYAEIKGRRIQVMRRPFAL
ncbi:hypothetical protein [Pseudomonas muyukensis]|nr:hypothetical protein [Pseudomonas muyukensis]